MIFNQPKDSKVKLESIKDLKSYLKSKVETFGPYTVDSFDVVQLFDNQVIVRVRVHTENHRKWFFFGFLEAVIADISKGVYE